MALAVMAGGTAYAVGVLPVSEVMVVDANAKRLGLYSPATTSVLMLLDRTLLSVRVTKDGFVGEWEALFATPDCVGTPYMLASDLERNASDLLDSTLYKQIGSVMWVGDPDGATTAVTIRSRGNFDRCFKKEGLPAAGTPVLPLTEFADLAALFKPPFHVLAK